MRVTREDGHDVSQRDPGQFAFDSASRRSTGIAEVDRDSWLNAQYAHPLGLNGDIVAWGWTYFAIAGHHELPVPANIALSDDSAMIWWGPFLPGEMVESFQFYFSETTHFEVHDDTVRAAFHTAAYADQSGRNLIGDVAAFLQPRFSTFDGHQNRRALTVVDSLCLALNSAPGAEEIISDSAVPHSDPIAEAISRCTRTDVGEVILSECEVIDEMGCQRQLVLTNARLLLITALAAEQPAVMTIGPSADKKLRVRKSDLGPQLVVGGRSKAKQLRFVITQHFARELEAVKKAQPLDVKTGHSGYIEVGMFDHKCGGCGQSISTFSGERLARCAGCYRSISGQQRPDDVDVPTMDQALDESTLGKEVGDWITPGSANAERLAHAQAPAAAGWYIDPLNSDQARFYEGTRWTGRARRLW